VNLFNHQVNLSSSLLEIGGHNTYSNVSQVDFKGLFYKPAPIFMNSGYLLYSSETQIGSCEEEKQKALAADQF
jgi:hypothetical protein